MDPRFPLPGEDLYNLQMEVKQVQYTQSNHAERLLRLEKRQADDAALKSVWNSPFPGVLSGTPQQEPVAIPHNDIFEDLDEQGEQLLESLHLGPTEEEPIRRGAASRANSVRFDESALHGSGWGGQSNRHSGDFGPVRPGSSLMMERSSSHKSDGRHSSAGHSVHSHTSGRASSLGLDTNFAIGDDDEDESPFEMPGLPASFYVLGTVPSIIRCWLTPDYAHKTLLYADICTGSQRSTVDYSLVRDLGLTEDIQRDVDGVHWARLTVYFAEAVVTQGGSRSASPQRSVPHIAVLFEVTGIEQPTANMVQNAIRIYIGSDALRAHSADILFSRNTMMLYGDDHDRLRVPFVRPEDDAVFRHIYTMSVIPEKPKLNASAAPFVFGSTTGDIVDVPRAASPHVHYAESEPTQEPSPAPTQSEPDRPSDASVQSERAIGSEKTRRESGASSFQRGRTGSEEHKKNGQDASSGIWSSWRQTSRPNLEGVGKDGESLSGYQPASRGGSRTMKILKPQRAVSSKAGNAAADSPMSARSTSEGRRKSLASATETANNGNGSPTVAGNVGSSRWDVNRTNTSGPEMKPTNGKQVLGRKENLGRSANPVGTASAFSWMAPPGSKS